MCLDSLLYHRQNKPKIELFLVGSALKFKVHHVCHTLQLKITPNPSEVDVDLNYLQAYLSKIIIIISLSF